MIRIKTLTLKNFLSIGNSTQAINLNREELVLVLGENLDLGGEDAGARNGCGKAQPLTSKILTPTGWTLMGDVHLDDEVITPTGSIGKITGIYPQGYLETFRITFADGRTAESSAEHLWKTYSHKFNLDEDHNKERVLTTQQIIDHLNYYQNYKSKQSTYIYIPLIEPKKTEDIDLPINPWLLGALLGDGGLSKKGNRSGYVRFTSSDSFMIEKFDFILNRDFNCSLKPLKSKKNKYDFSIKMNVRGKFNPVGLQLMDLELAGTKSDTKFIPKCYMQASIQQRKEMLAGLIDTDGTVAKGGSLSISTASYRLATDISYLVRSIGGLAKISTKRNRTYVYKGVRKSCKDSYKISIRYFNMRSLISLPRKQERIKLNYQYADQLRLQIIKIEPIGKQECQCIMIDDSNHLYITDNFVVTHNTAIMNALSYVLYSWPISDIKKEHLINKSNGKNMLVTLDFESDGKEYRIVRGLKPRILEFYENGKKRQEKEPAKSEIEDSAQGDNRETQREIEKVLGMSHDMFCQIVAVNTYTQPFLFQKNTEQRTIIEQLLGITMLSEKAEQLKDEIKSVREHITTEEARIKAVESANKRIQKQIDSLNLKQKAWDRSREDDLAKLQKKIEKLSRIDIDQELIAHELWDVYNTAERERTSLTNQKTQLESVYEKEAKIFNRYVQDLKSLKDQCCQTCKQKIKTETHELLVKDVQIKKKTSELEMITVQEQIDVLITNLAKIPVFDIPPEQNYDSLNEAHEHRNKLMLLNQEFQQKQNDVDPYQDQIISMQNSALEVVDLETLNALGRFVDHQEFLLKLLTNKDSFIRKKIIEQNLNYLNARLNYYLTALGLPHEVVFQNDLSVVITELGRELSPGNLSRGEMARLCLGLSFSFRDVWESLFQKISILMMDESIDAGIDSNGTDAAVKLLRDLTREHHKDVWLISHKDDLISKCSSICKVVKENGFTSFSFDD